MPQRAYKHNSDRKDNKSLARMKKCKTQDKDHILLSVVEKS